MMNSSILRLILLMLIGTPVSTIAQINLGNEWRIGLIGYNVNFTTTPISHDTFAQTIYTFNKSTSNICDPNGSLILMSTGWDVCNKSGVVLDDGDTLAYPSAYTHYNGSNNAYQGSLFLPKENNQYYFINLLMNDTCFDNYLNQGPAKMPYNMLNYHVIDMNANAGQGKVIERMKPIIENAQIMKSGLTACRHGNGQDWWIVTADIDSNNYYLSLVTNDSIVTNNIQRLPSYNRSYMDIAGQMVFNPSGTQLARVNSSSSASLLLMDFDRCHGVLSNFKQIPFAYDTMPGGYADSIAAGVAFSPNGRFIYVNTYAHMYQFDLQDSSWTTIGDWDTTWNQFNGYTNTQLAPDGRIFIGHKHGFAKDYSLISNPDVKGLGANFCKRCFTAQSISGYMSSPPNMPNYALGAKTCWPLSQSESPEPSAEQWKLFPNPASTEVTLQWSSSPSVTTLITISDMTGRVRKMVEVAPSTNNAAIPVADLEYGVYVVELIQEGKTRFTEKLIVE